MCLKALSSQFPGSLRVKRLIAMKHEALNQLVNNISQHICSFECNYCNLFVGFIDLSNKIVLLIVLID
jgi:hypothetical protein